MSEKRLFIAEKPSVAREFARVLGANDSVKRDGYIESENMVVTWCVGHLVTMSYPEAYDKSYAKWNFNTIPFLPDKFKYEVISGVKKQFKIVEGLLNREDVTSIYVCTDSGREGEYIYRLVDMMAKVPATKKKYRVWIDSQTEEEIKRGVNEAKELSEYDNLSASAFLRAKEDYLMGINFSRALSLKYGGWLNNNIKSKKWAAIAVGRVMTCVLGMVVKREWEIRNFVKTPFYRVLCDFGYGEDKLLKGEWHVDKESFFNESKELYKENGFANKESANKLIDMIKPKEEATLTKLEKKKEKKNPPLLFNLAELQNLSSKVFKISPDETLAIVQELYEKKLVTYPRTDARVLSTAVAKEITKNLSGLQNYPMALEYIREIKEMGSYKGLEKTRYCDDKKITDHYAIIPTGQGLGALNSMSDLNKKMYEVIVRRFLSIFYPPATYQKINAVITVDTQVDEKPYKENFHVSQKLLVDKGFLDVSTFSFAKEKKTDSEDNVVYDMSELKKGMVLKRRKEYIKEGETSPPKRYNSGSMILAMENAGQLIEDEEMRALIKGSGIGTSATRAEILKKLFNISYLKLNKKTQIITPTLKGELVCAIVRYSIPSMLSPKLTASWEKGLYGVADGNIEENDYLGKLENFIKKNVEDVKVHDNLAYIKRYYGNAIKYYNK